MTPFAQISSIALGIIAVGYLFFRFGLACEASTVKDVIIYLFFGLSAAFGAAIPAYYGINYIVKTRARKEFEDGIAQVLIDCSDHYKYGDRIDLEPLSDEECISEMAKETGIDLWKYIKAGVCKMRKNDGKIGVVNPKPKDTKP